MDQPDLDHIPYDADIASREGMSIDQLSRARLQFAIAQNTSLVSQTQFADAKAGTLLALVGLLAAHVAGGRVSMSVLAVGALMALNALVIGLCVAVLVPRIGKAGHRAGLSSKDRFSWPGLVDDDYTGDAHAGFLRTAQASQMVMSVARANAAVARILLVKYRLLRVAFVIALADIVATLAAAAIPAT